MSRATLTAAAGHFFLRVLPAATRKRYSELSHRSVHLGAYRRHTGGPVQALGQTVTPEFVLHVVGAAAAVQNDTPAFGDAPVPAATARHLLWMRYAADPKMDDQATIQDLMGDLDTYAARKLNMGGVEIEIPEGLPAPANSQQWAQTIQANRGAIPDNLASLTEVPAAFRTVAPSLEAFKVVMSHFFTYDANGAYYPRWSGAGRQMPNDLTPVYRQNNVRELKLGRDEMYLYMLVPKALFTTQGAQPHDYSEAVMRFDATGDPANPYQPTLIQSVYKRMPQGAAAFHDFVFFEAEDGIGLNVPQAARAKMSGPLTTFLLSIPDRGEDRAPFFHNTTYVIEGTPPLVSLMATLSADDVTLPAGVSGAMPESGGLVMLNAPIERIPEIALLPGVQHLDITGHPSKQTMTLARPAVTFDAFRAKYTAAKQDGAGVIVGIIDSGIDGNHPSFKDAAGNSRILAYWDQNDGAANNPNSPTAHNPGKAAYSGMNFGRERTGADCVNAADYGIGHGTHVSGIAAGSEVTTPAPVPRGIASRANLVVVAAIGGTVSRPDLGLRYVFQKATELKMACVVNMSFGHHFHPHDGTDDLSRSLTRQLRNSAKKYIEGRILVSAAGNERDDPIHVRRALVTRGSAIIRFVVNGLADPTALPARDDVVMWIRMQTAGTTPNLRVAVQDPASGWTSAAVTPSTSPKSINIPGMNLRVLFSSVVNDPHNGDFNINIGFVPATGTAGIPQKEWRLLVSNPGQPVEMNAWAGRDGAFLASLEVDNEMKIGTPACAFDVICVAATCSRLQWNDIDNAALTRNFAQPQLGDITSFSSPGPIRAASNKMISFFGMQFNQTHPAIDIAAPGSAIQSALASVVPVTTATAAGTRNRTRMVNNLSWMMQGTSMASPIIAGLVACLLAEEPRLTQAQVRDRVRAAGRLPDKNATIFKPGAPDSNDWGPGLVHAPTLKP